MERNVYAAVIDKTIDDQLISEQEHCLINTLEKIVTISDEYKLETKKEVFRLLYLDIIADHEINPEEIEKIKSYLSGLELHESDVREELKVIREILRMQKLSLPLKPVEILVSNLQKKKRPITMEMLKCYPGKRLKNHLNTTMNTQYVARADLLLLIKGC